MRNYSGRSIGSVSATARAGGTETTLASNGDRQPRQPRMRQVMRPSLSPGRRQDRREGDKPKRRVNDRPA